jgi:hypothetical protein
MGENKHIEELDAFAKKYVKEIKREKPSFGFTEALMHAIVLEEKQKSVFKTTVLISKKVWLFLACIFAAFIFIPFSDSDKRLVEIPEIDFSFFDKIQIPTIFSTISISNITFFAILLFGFMLMVQVIFLRNHFNKRFEEITKK